MDFVRKMSAPSQKQVMLLALTFVVVMIIVMICPDAMTALVIIGALLGFYAAYVAAGAADGTGGGFGAEPKAPRWASHHAPAAARCEGGVCPVKEGYNPLPGAPAPHALMSVSRAPSDIGHYPGAIDADEYDSEAAYGHRDRTEGDNEGAPAGNPFNRNRVSFQPAADACIDDEANDAEMDGDELMTHHGRARNDPERVTAGTMNRRRDLDKYFREEVEEAEDREWWGRYEE